ncbi:type I polyketide synthase [Nocardia sp. GTS18]|uniref:type I polyketide synthase n=1 Tax=Nocardia sp. GTS18 TaxID=1778064 RepID=UPI0015EE92EE
MTVERRLARDPIAIVGMSGLLPKAHTHREYWQNIIDGVDCTSEVPASRWSLDDYYDADRSAPDKTYSRRGAFLPDVAFDPLEFGLPPNQLEVTSTMQTLSLGVARDLLADAGATGSQWYDPARTGVVLGTTGPVPLMHPLAARLSTPVLAEAGRSMGLSESDVGEISRRFVAAFAPWEENSFPGLLANVVAGRVANRLGLGGMNCTVDAACAASLAAIRTAIAELQDGRADMMITGGVDTENSIFIYLCFSKVGALSPTGRISPFSAEADGTLLGEGITMLALRRLADARRDGNRIYAVIRGLGSSSDGRSKSIYAPRAEGQRVALDRAYADAECSPADVELIEAHATGTAVGDKTELTALKGLLAEASSETGFAALGSVKSQIGHTKGAAGTAGVMKLALALHQKVLPSTINVDAPNSEIDATRTPFYVNTMTRPWVRDPQRPVRRAAASAMGFGGTNFHIVLEEADQTRGQVLHRVPRAHLWHAPDVAALIDVVRSTPGTDGGDIPAGHARIGFVSVDDDTAADLRTLAVDEMVRNPDAAHWDHPEGVYFRAAAVQDPKVGVLFAGQGSQYVDMGLDTVLNNPPVGAAFDEANAAFVGAEQRLGAVVFPPPAFTEQTRTEQESALRRTEFAQPAIGALAAGQFRVLTEFGLRAHGYLGHSFGELTALWASGALSTEDFFGLARARGAAMTVADDAEAGTMVAVNAARDEVAEVIADLDDVWICNHNAPDQIVVGGGPDGIAAFTARSAEKGWATRDLPVAAAFHTPYVAHAVTEFGAAVEEVDIVEPDARVYADTAGASYGADVAANRATLTAQLSRPVEFVDALRAMHADGCTIFVECGPKQVLTSLVRRTLGEYVIAFATDSGPIGNGDVALKRAAVRLAVLGVEMAGINRYAAPATEPTSPAAGRMTVTLSAPEYVPAARRAAYAEALSGDYRVQLAADTAAHSHADPEPVSALVDSPTASPRRGPTLSDLPATVPASVVADSHAVVGARTGAPSYPISESPAVSELSRRPSVPPLVEEQLVTIPVDPLDTALVQHLDTHRQYLDGQLDLARGLAGALNTGAIDDRLLRAIEAVKDHGVAISESHSRASEVLAQLAEIEGGAAGSHSVTSYRTTPHAVNAPAPTQALTAASTQAPANGHLPEPAPLSSGTATTDTVPGAVTPAESGTAYPTGPRAGQGVTGASNTAPQAAGTASVAPGEHAATPSATAQTAARTAGSDAQHPAVGPEQGAGAEALDGEAIRAALREVVADKTGYPVEMVDPAMDLEADLGVDSIKRVQVIGALQERFPSLPSLGPEQLGTLRTLDQIADLLATDSPTTATDTSAATGDPAAPTGGSAVATDEVASSDADPTHSAETLRQALREVVADKTGYPVEMVDPAMDLEADLGVDSIKRVQVIGALQERFPSLPSLGPEQLGTLRTLDQIADLLADDGPTAAGAASGSAAPAAASDADEVASVDADLAPTAETLRQVLREVVADKTGYPVEMVDPAMDLEADLGVDSIKRVQVIGALQERFPTLPSLGPEQLGTLRSLDQIVAELAGGDVHPKGEAAAETSRHVVELVELAPVDLAVELYRPAGRALVVCLDESAETDVEAIEEALRALSWTVRRVEPGADTGAADLCVVVAGVATEWAQAERILTDTILVTGRVVPALRGATGRAGFVTVTRLDGHLGLRGDADPVHALLGGLGGVVKTLAAEEPTLFCRALDIAPAATPARVAQIVLEELCDAAIDTIEVGVDASGLRRTPVPSRHKPAVVAETVSTATGFGPTLLTEDDLLLVTGGARGVTATCVLALARHSAARFLLLGRTTLGEEPAWATGVPDTDLKPAAVRALAGTGVRPKDIERACGDLRAVREIRSTLATLGDRADYLAVDATDATALAEAVAPWRDRITGVVHGAGVLADSMIPDKTVDSIARVLRPKLGGLAAVLAAVGEPKDLVLFTSVAGLFGNAGQADYAAANEALCRFAVSWRRRHPGHRVTAIDWGAWDGGMVTADLREHFRARGIPLLAPAAGAAAFTTQFTADRRPEPILLVGAATALSTGEHVPATVRARRDTAGLVDEPVIEAHRIGDHLVLPATFGLGVMIHLAERTRPGRTVVGVRDYQVLKGLVFDHPVTALEIELVPLDDLDGRTAVRATVFDGKLAHFRATLLLAANPDGGARQTIPAGPGIPADRIYRDAIQFHGPALQGLRAIRAESDSAIVLDCHLPTDPVAVGAYAGHLHDPVAADLILQGPPVLGHRLLGTACLPLGVGRIDYHHPLPTAEPFVLVVDNPRAGRLEARIDATALSTDGTVLQRFSDVTVLTTPDLTDKFQTSVRKWTR